MEDSVSSRKGRSRPSPSGGPAGSTDADPVVGLGEVIRVERKRAGLTQRDLGAALGCSDGYVAHMERGLKIPSLEMGMSLAEVLGFSAEKRTGFLKALEHARVERTGDRIRARGVAVRSALAGRQDTAATIDTLDPDQIAIDLATYPKLRDAYRNLKTALADKEMRDVVLKALQAFATSAKPSTG
jgi:transcriptional regulator with XRE-family HTH domain